MSNIQSLIEEYIIKIRNKSRQKQYMEAIKLNSEFISKVEKLVDPIDEITDELNRVVSNPCEGYSEYWVIVAQRHPSIQYVDALCAILTQKDQCIGYEDIIRLLGNIKDPKAVPYLIQALDYDFERDQELHDIPRTALNALAKIGTPEAIDAVKSMLNSPIDKVRWEAESIMKYIE